MTDIPNTQYITINKDGIFVGGKPAVYYRMRKILYNTIYTRLTFDLIQKQHPEIIEIDVMSSKTYGEDTEILNPSEKHGPNAWCRIKFNDGHVGSWEYFCNFGKPSLCARLCLDRCMAFCYRKLVHSAVLVQTPQKPINPVVVAANNEAQIKR